MDGAQMPRLLMLCFIILTACQQSSESTAVSKQDKASEDREEPGIACEQFVQDALDTPSTAKFLYRQQYVVLPGKNPNGVSSPAIRIAAYFADGLTDPYTGAIFLNRRIGFLTADQLLKIQRYWESGDRGEARAVIRNGLQLHFLKSDFVVSGNVDAQNNYGAMIRWTFLCLTSRAGTQWRPDGVAVFY